MRVFFGERWDAPMLDDATQVETPIGEPCMWCEYPIREGERGMVTPIIRANDSVLVRPGHKECELPSVFGGPAHIRGECTHVGSCQEGFTDRRELGLATLAALNAERATRGQGPL